MELGSRSSRSIHGLGSREPPIERHASRPRLGIDDAQRPDWRPIRRRDPGASVKSKARLARNDLVGGSASDRPHHAPTGVYEALRTSSRLPSSQPRREVRLGERRSWDFERSRGVSRALLATSGNLSRFRSASDKTNNHFEADIQTAWTVLRANGNFAPTYCPDKRTVNAELRSLGWMLRFRKFCKMSIKAAV